MKKFIKISILALIVGVTGITNVQAQQYNDAKMKQDLRISEGILSDLTQQNDQGNRLFRSGSDLSSVYIPGFGVIFETTPSIMMLELTRANTVNVVGPDDQNENTRVVVTGTSNLNDSEKKTSMDSMKEHIQTYFMNYADLISQVKPDENITVMVRPNDSFVFLSNPPPPPTPTTPPTPGSNQNVTTVRASGASTLSRSTGFMMSVKRSDINDFKAQRINENEFKNRIRVTDITSESNTEFKIFEKILETGMNNIGNETFSLSKNLTSVYDENLGLIILGSLRSTETNFYFQGFRDLEQFDIDVPKIDLDSVDTEIVIKSGQFRFDRDDLDSLKVDMRRANEELRRAQIEITRAASDIRRELDGTIRIRSSERTESRSKEQLEQDLQQFEDALKNLILDYGRTLNSVKSDQSIMLNLRIRNSIDGLPSRMVINIPKKTLEAFDKRSISKETALGQITVNRIN